MCSWRATLCPVPRNRLYPYRGVSVASARCLSFEEENMADSVGRTIANTN